MERDLVGKVMLVTGASSGIGLEAGVQLAARGAEVILVARDRTRGEAALADVRQRAGSEKVSLMLCDLSSQAAIRAFAAEFLERHDRLDVLVNNAGGVSDHRTVTVDGIEQTFAVNHLAYFQLTLLLLDLLERSAPSRVVNVASRGHERGTMDIEDPGYEKGGYSIMGAYCRSKLGNVLFTNELARRMAGRGVTANSVHPGGVATNIWSRAPGWAKPFIAVIGWFALIPPSQGARPLVHLAGSAEMEGRTGEYWHELRRKEPSALARDADLAARLWARSAELVGVG
ncbi:MAG: SDR family oxidoreductase [Pseudomonadota bacterium]|nr:SDR family oxidoreductase [Pseudomonadota bacterium]